MSNMMAACSAQDLREAFAAPLEGASLLRPCASHRKFLITAAVAQVVEMTEAHQLLKDIAAEAATRLLAEHTRGQRPDQWRSAVIDVIADETRVLAKATQRHVATSGCPTEYWQRRVEADFPPGRWQFVLAADRIDDESYVVLMLPAQSALSD